MPLTDHQLWSISIASRTAASLSLLGTAVVWAAFLTSNRFRKPINRLVFYATIGNVVADLVTLIGRNGIILGVDTPLCQFQAFVDQW
jgi:membrane protein YqaA with SNARE-associated domain